MTMNDPWSRPHDAPNRVCTYGGDHDDRRSNDLHVEIGSKAG